MREAEVNSPPPAGQKSLGVLAIVLSVLTALWAAWHFFHSPVVDVYLLLYPWALFLGWCGEAWLHECGPAARLRQDMASIWTRRDEITSVIVLIVAAGVL